MSQPGEEVPAYRMIRVTRQDGPIAAFADEEAWRAREGYPDIRGAGGPVFVVVQECEDGGWQVVTPGGETPQSARESLSAVLRKRAEALAASGDEAASREFLRAAERLDWEVVDELTVRESRYRVARAEQFIRTGPEGPEPPRPSDPDTAEPGAAHRLPSRTEGFVIDPYTGTGLSEGMLKAELLSLVRKQDTAPADAWADSVRAAEDFPGGVLLPAEFMTVEREGAGWQPVAGCSSTPQGARDALATYLRVLAPLLLKLNARRRVEYALAADRLDAQPGAELDVAERHFRVVRVERLVRVGPDGPEGPRPSDPDPDPPIGLHTQQLREQGLLDDEDEDVEPELTVEQRELMDSVFDQEQARRARRDPGGG